MRIGYSCILLVLGATNGIAADPIPRTPVEIWEAVYARDRADRDQKIGYSRILLEPISVDGKNHLRATRELNITIKREGQRAQLSLKEGTEENADGVVTGVFMKLMSGNQVMWDIEGKVQDKGKAKELQIRQEGIKSGTRSIPWDPMVISVYGEQTILREKKVRPGDSVTYRMYTSTLGTVVTIRAAAEVEQEITQPNGQKRKLLRVESEMEPIEGFQLPPTTTWLDPKTYEIVVTQSMTPDFGMMTFLRTTKEVAMGPLGELPDIVAQQSIRLEQRVQGDIHELAGVDYKVTIRGTSDPEKLLKVDDRQIIKNFDRKEKTFDLHVEAKRAPVKLAKVEPAAEEYLKANPFTDSDDELIQQLSKKAVGTEKDPWKQAKAIEKFVRNYITEATYTQALDTATQVAKSRKGDCTEFAMLTVAMCRAAKIPSRTAVGLIYVEKTRFSERPVLAFHMWTEVYVEGQWLGLDSTLARGSIGPGHIKITDHSWDKVNSLKPLLPVTGFIMARPTVAITGATK